MRIKRDPDRGRSFRFESMRRVHAVSGHRCSSISSPIESRPGLDLITRSPNPFKSHPKRWALFRWCWWSRRLASAYSPLARVILNYVSVDLYERASEACARSRHMVWSLWLLSPSILGQRATFHACVPFFYDAEIRLRHFSILVIGGEPMTYRKQFTREPFPEFVASVYVPGLLSHFSLGASSMAGRQIIAAELSSSFSSHFLNGFLPRAPLLGVEGTPRGAPRSQSASG